MKVIYNEKGKQVEKVFSTEEEGKKIKNELKKKGIKGAKWEW